MVFINLCCQGECIIGGVSNRNEIFESGKEHVGNGDWRWDVEAEGESFLKMEEAVQFGQDVRI